MRTFFSSFSMPLLPMSVKINIPGQACQQEGPWTLETHIFSWQITPYYSSHTHAYTCTSKVTMPCLSNRWPVLATLGSQSVRGTRRHEDKCVEWDCCPWLEKTLLLHRVTWEPWVRRCDLTQTPSPTAGFSIGPVGHEWHLSCSVVLL